LKITINYSELNDRKEVYFFKSEDSILGKLDISKPNRYKNKFTLEINNSSNIRINPDGLMRREMTTIDELVNKKGKYTLTKWYNFFGHGNKRKFTYGEFSFHIIDKEHVMNVYLDDLKVASYFHLDKNKVYRSNYLFDIKDETLIRPLIACGLVFIVEIEVNGKLDYDGVA
jgi:hypothetical protein